MEFPDFGRIHEESLLLEKIRNDAAEEARLEAKQNEQSKVGYVDPDDLE